MIGNSALRGLGIAPPVPPGYSDAAKKGAEASLGDYFIWEQTLIEAKQRQLPVLFVTNEKRRTGSTGRAAICEAHDPNWSKRCSPELVSPSAW
ncbi:PIN-like domain-containing protein [Streptosporangium sp. NPDC002524]|uniref:PIN-like domain-containing protein n=1 Tax=Streptosporangium sp. NPDC002524 TaxID=3154537 RepID=UPI003330CAD4